MKHIEITTKISTEVLLDGKPVESYLKEIADLCHSSLEESTSQNEECETLYEDNMYEEVYSKMQDRVSTLEGTLCRILDLLGD